MSYRCSICGSEMERTRGDYPFPEVGLKGVVLKDVEMLRCKKCASVDAVIPRLRLLLRTLAEMLLVKRGLLCGEEIRFLRLHLGMGAAEFAELVGVDKSTLSRWEHDRQLISPSNDRLIRLVSHWLMNRQPREKLESLLSLKNRSDHACAKFIVEERDGEYHAEIA